MQAGLQPASIRSSPTPSELLSGNDQRQASICPRRTQVNLAMTRSVAWMVSSIVSRISAIRRCSSNGMRGSLKAAISRSRNRRVVGTHLSASGLLVCLIREQVVAKETTICYVWLWTRDAETGRSHKAITSDAGVRAELRSYGSEQHVAVPDDSTCSTWSISESDLLQRCHVDRSM